jgi:hypothetical protein
MKNTTLAIALMVASVSASATYCKDGSTIESHPNGDCNYRPPAETPQAGAKSSAEAAAAAAAYSASNSSARASQGQGQGQHQGQQQAQGQRTDQAQTAQQANAQRVSAGNGNSTGQSVTVQGAQAGSGDSYRSLAIALPSVPMTPPSFVAGATVTTTASACGPLQRIVGEPVYGDHNGVFSSSKVWLGNTEHTDLYLDERGDIKAYTAMGGRWFGHQVIYSTAALGVSSAANLTIGGGGSGGGWGQGGGGASGAMQRLVTTIQLRLCDVGLVAVPAVIIERAAVMMPHRPRPIVKRRPVPCVMTTVQVCKVRP